MDPFAIIADEQAAARQALVDVRNDDAADGSPVAIVPEQLEEYLDLEERIVLPWLDRFGAEGSAAMADGLDRHRAMLDLAHGPSPYWDRLLGALDGHVELTRAEVLPLLRHHLDQDGLEDLGDALEEARLSRTEGTLPLPAPLDQVGRIDQVDESKPA